jgi:EmrB/QacA subfamily drug resistance transporter
MVAASHSDVAALDARLKRLAVVVVIGMIMAILDTTIVIIATDTLSRDFNTSLSTIAWVTTGYLLSLSLVIPITGWAIERFGAKRMWILALSLFLAGSALCGTAWSVESLIAFRVLQGIGGGMIMPIGMSIMAAEAGPQRMGRVMSIIGVPALVAPVLGPVIGGLIVSNLSWRWIFYVNIPVGALALVLAVRILPADEGMGRRRLDLVGLALASPGLALCVYGLSEAGNSGSVASPKVLLSAGIGLLLVGLFIWHALRTAEPLMDVRLYGNRTFRVASITSFVIGAVLFGAMFVLPLYYQVDRGQSALVAGLLMAPQGLGAMTGMIFSGRIVDRSGAGTVVPVGVVLVILGTLAYTQVGAHTNEGFLAVALFVRGIGMGFSMMPTMSAAYSTLERHQVPRATTMLNIVQRVGGSLGTALYAVILQRQITEHIPGAHGLADVPSGGLNEHAATVIGHAFSHTFWWVFFSGFLALVPALMLPRHAAGAFVEDGSPVGAGVGAAGGGPAVTAGVGAAEPAGSGADD